MARPRFETAIGVIDGVNQIFRTSRPYDAGSLAVFLNGQLKRRWFEDGWVETDPGGSIFFMNEAPQTLDDVQVFYLDSSDQPVVVEQIRNLTARIRPRVRLIGRISCSAR